MAGRTDDSKYGFGLALCKNGYPLPQGPVVNRSGFMYVAQVKDSSKAVRLVPFVYSADQQLVVELGDKYARFHLEGQTLMNAEGTAPYEIETPWSADELFQIHYTQNADIMTLCHPAHPPQELKRYSMQDWRLEAVSLITTLVPPTTVTAERITQSSDTTNSDKYTQYYVVTSLNADRTEESQKSAVASIVANLYATGTTVQISWTAVEGASFYRVYKLQGGIYGYIGETDGLSIIDDNLAPETGTTPPYIDDVFGVSSGIESAWVNAGGSGYAIGGSITGYSTTGTYNLNTSESVTLPYKFEGNYYNPTAEVVDNKLSGSGASITVNYVHDWYSYVDNSGDSSTTVYVYYTEVTGFTINNGGSGYSDDVSIVMTLSGNSKYTFKPIITQQTTEIVVEDASGFGAVIVPTITNGVITAVQLTSPGQGYTNPTVRVVSSSGSGASIGVSVAASTYDYPAAVGYYEQRRIFAGTRLYPQKVWMTVTGTESNMTYHLPVTDTDRISFAVASRDLNQIQHIVSLSQLIMLTNSAEWRVSPLNSDAITPTSISVRPQAYVGASNVQPEIMNANLIYVASRGGHIRELAYNYNAGGYVTGDLSLRAPHLFTQDNQPVDLAQTKAPDPTLWVVMEGGELYGFLYVPEQNIGAWYQFLTDGRFESATVIQEDYNDYLYVVVRRTINGAQVRYIERQVVRDDTTRTSCYLDCAGHLVASTAAKTVTGITWLEGCSVTAVADGIVYKNLTVTDGSITLPRAASNVWVGLPYETLFKTLPLVVNLQTGSYSRGYVKNINRVALRYINTSGIEVSSDGNDYKPVKARTTENYGLPPELRTEEVNVSPLGTWQTDGTIYIRQKEPLPFTLVSHSVSAVIGDE